MKNENKSNQKDPAQDILNRILANIPIDIKVDFGTNTIAETFRDGSILTKQINIDNPEYIIDLKKNDEE